MINIPISEAQIKAVKKYHNNNYKFLKLRFKKGEKELIKQQAEEQEMSLTQYIRYKLGLEE